MSQEQVPLELDCGVRRTSRGTVLLGGSPFRLIRLSRSGSQLLDRWLAGHDVPPSKQATSLRTRLTAAGMVHPLPSAACPLPAVAFVVPVYDDAGGLAELLESFRRDFVDRCVVVVDDNSPNPASLADVAALFDAQLLRHETNRGPAAARNTGWRAVRSQGETKPAEVVLFVDADVVPTPGSLRLALAHFVDPSVAAVAPRVRAQPGFGRLSVYEGMNSPLDLGPDPAIVVPGARIAYVPSAALAIRTAALAASDGFDEDLRFGEDVDLVWRLTDDGQTVRYEPRAIVHRRSRDSLGALVRQRHSYGSSASELASRHGTKVAPLKLPADLVAITLATIFGGAPIRIAAFASVLARTVPLKNKLVGRVDHPAREAAQLTVMGLGYATHGLASAATRAWLPLLMATKRTRRAAAAALIIPAVIEWFRARPANGPLTHTVLRAIDHAAYCSGVWAGVLRQRSPAALLPDMRFAERQHD